VADIKVFKVKMTQSRVQKLCIRIYLNVVNSVIVTFYRLKNENSFSTKPVFRFRAHRGNR
jgi:hypothetical protein